MLNNVESDFLPVTSGVPQGSILGSILFLIFINDMPDVIFNETSLLLFERDYFLGGIRLERVDVENDLGVLVAYNLNWNSHVDHITSRAQKMLNLLHRSLRVKIYLTSKPRNCSI